MKPIILAFLIGLFMNTVTAQSKSYQFPHLGWEVSIPNFYDVTDSTEMEELMNLNQSLKDLKGESSDTVNLLLVIDPEGLLEAMEIGYIKRKGGAENWAENFRKYVTLMYSIVESKKEFEKIDTLTRVEYIKGKEFKVFHLTFNISASNKQMKHIIYGIPIKEYDFYIKISSTRENFLNKMKNILLESKFN